MSVMPLNDVMNIRDQAEAFVHVRSGQVIELIESHEDLRSRIGALVAAIEQHLFNRMRESSEISDTDQRLWDARVIGWLDRVPREPQ